MTINKYIYDTTVPNVGFNGRMGIADIMETVQYAVMLHTVEMDVAYQRILADYNGKWVIAKLRMEFDGIPVNGSALHIETWPHKAGMLKFGRSFTVTDGADKSYVRGYSDWCVIDADTFEIKRAKEIALPDIDYIPDKVINGKYSRPMGVEGEFVYEKTVRVSDLDINGHVNNVNYIRMAIDCFSSEELRGLELKSFEMHFTEQCFEGEKISFYRADRDGVIEIYAKKEGAEVFRAVINS